MTQTTLTNSLVFDIVGSLITSQGQYPTYLRYSPAAQESVVNGSLRSFPVAVHQPRFTSNGSLILEKGSQNLITFPLDLSNSEWVKGSSMTILRDLVPAMDGNFLADRVSVSAFTGNAAANTISRRFALDSAQTYTLTAYLGLAGGQLGPNDVLRVTGDVVTPASINLSAAYNPRPGNYIASSLNFTTAGTAPVSQASNETLRVATIALYCERAVSIDWAGIQLEPGNLQTSFINQTTLVTGRDADSLTYPRSPVSGLPSFTFFCNLEAWRGDGVIVNAGNFRVEIIGGKLRATCGVTTATDPGDLPASAQIAVRVSQGLGNLQVYVNGVLKVRQSLSGFTGAVSTVTVGGQNVLQIKCLYFFNRDLADGSIDVGGNVAGELLQLNQQDSLLTDLSEGHSRIVFPSVRCRAGREVSVRFPQYPFAQQTLATVTPGVSSAFQSDRIDVFVAPGAGVIDYLFINGTYYSYTADGSPTQAETAAGLVAAVNATPKVQPVTATHTPGDAFFILTGDTAGNDFSLSISSNLRRTNQTSAGLASNTLTVPNAVDFVLGPAQIFRQYAFICDVIITAINTGTNTITFTTTPNSLAGQIQAGDTLMQPTWSLRIGQTAYFAHHLEDFSDIKISGKSPEGFRFINRGLLDRLITPYAKLSL